MFIHNLHSYLSLDRTILNIGLGFVVIKIQSYTSNIKIAASINNPLLGIIKSRKKWISINRLTDIQKPNAWF